MKVITVPVGDVHGGRNPRSTFDDDRFAELVASVKQDGILEPIRATPNQNGYQIESGHRRFNAALAAGLTEIPVVVVDGATKADEFVRAIVTNVQREDMNPVDEARAFQTLIAEHGLTVDGVADRLGVSRRRVTERLELLDLPEQIQQLYFDRVMRLDCRAPLRAIAQVDRDLALAVADLCAAKDEYMAVLAKEPMRVAAYVASQDTKKRWYVLPGRIDRDALPLTKKQREAAAELDGQYSTWTPAFTEEDLGQANAAGVAYIDKQADNGVVVDAKWLAAHFDQVLRRRKIELEERKKRLAQEEAAAKASKMDVKDLPPEDQAKAELEKAYRRAEREALAEAKVAARAANLELGRKLFLEFPAPTKGLSRDLAEAIVADSIGRHTSDLWLSGARYCLEETQKVDDKGKVSYVQAVVEAGQQAHAWLNRADTGDELLRRAIILLAWSLFADQGAVAQSDRRSKVSDPSEYVGSHKVPVLSLVKPLTKAIKQHVPAGLRGQLKPSDKVMTRFREQWKADHAGDEQKAEG